MGFEFSIQVRDQYLHAKVSNRTTLQHYRAFYDAVIAESVASGINLILVDSSETVPHPRLWVIDVATSFPRQPQRRIAGLYRNEAVFNANASYVEDVTANRGILVKNFNDEADAIEWLLADC